MRAMTLCRVLFLVVTLGVARVGAQLDVSCRFEDNRVIQFEPVKVVVEISNASGEKVDLSNAEPGASLSFFIERTPGRAVPQIGEVRSEEPLVVAPGRSIRRTLDLSRSYDLRATGPYTVQARVRWRGRTVGSAKAFLDILPGMEVAQTTAQLPQDPGVLLHFGLRTLERNQGDYLFLRVEDKERGRCHGVYELGRVLRMMNPVIRADLTGEVHVLHQSGPTQYTHSRFTAQGRPVGRENYSSEAPARLVEAPGGRLVVKVDEAEAIGLDPREENPAAAGPAPPGRRAPRTERQPAAR